MHKTIRPRFKSKRTLSLNKRNATMSCTNTKMPHKLYGRKGAPNMKSASARLAVDSPGSQNIPCSQQRFRHFVFDTRVDHVDTYRVYTSMYIQYIRGHARTWASQLIHLVVVCWAHHQTAPLRPHLSNLQLPVHAPHDDDGVYKRVLAAYASCNVWNYN